LFEAVASDERFLIRAGLGGPTGEDTPVEALEVTPRPHERAGRTPANPRKDFRDIFKNAVIMHAPSLQGGYAGLGCKEGRPPDERPIVLALSPSNLRTAAAAHELFHLARHVRRDRRFEDEEEMNILAVVWEEAKVWTLTILFAPLRGIFELLLILTIRLGLLVSLASYLILRLIFPDRLW
jgi:hypothetical protein